MRTTCAMCLGDGTNRDVKVEQKMSMFRVREDLVDVSLRMASMTICEPG